MLYDKLQKITSDMRNERNMQIKFALLFAILFWHKCAFILKADIGVPSLSPVSSSLTQFVFLNGSDVKPNTMALTLDRNTGSRKGVQEGDDNIGSKRDKT